MPQRHLLCDMGSQISEVDEESSVHGAASSSHGLRQQSFPEGPAVPLKGAAAAAAAAVPVDSCTRSKVMLLCSLSHTHPLGSVCHLTYFPGKQRADLLPQSS